MPAIAAILAVAIYGFCTCWPEGRSRESTGLAQSVQSGPAVAERWEEAARRVTRLAPSAFADLPVRVRSLMAADGCRIPQDPSVGRPHNVISGRFARLGQRDWVAFCSANGSTAVHIYWGGSARCPALGYRMPDVQMLQDYVFFMHLATASPAALRAAGRAFEQKLPSIGHDGINIGSEKGGSAYYCDQGRWIEITTSD